MARFRKHALALAVAALLMASVGTVVAQSRAKTAGNLQHGDAKGLRVTDTKGNVETLLFQNGRQATIDYTLYDMLYHPDFEDGGLRIRKGEGKLVVKWDRLQRVQITKVTGEGAEGTMVTLAGDSQPIILMPWSKNGLTGTTELGEFSINLDKVKAIEVIR